MLEALRRGAQTRVAKVLFGLLVVSFGIWGVHDVFRGWGRGAVAKVGGTAISAEEFRRSYQDELDRVSQQAKKRITAEQGRAFGARQARSGSAHQWRGDRSPRRASLVLLFPTRHSSKASRPIPTSRTADGKFSKQGFDALLRQIGLSERGFLNLRRKDELRAALVGSFVKAQTVPKPLFDLMHAYNDEKRVIEWIKIDPEAVTVAGADGSQAQGGLRGRQVEIHDAGVPQGAGADAAASMTEEAGQRSATTTWPSPTRRRRIATIRPSSGACSRSPSRTRRRRRPHSRRCATARKSFGDVAKEAGAKDTDVDLGLVNKKALIDPKVADVAFTLEKDKYSDVVEGVFATVILRVTQIEPGVTR